jgi:protein-disulfide isomerase
VGGLLRVLVFVSEPPSAKCERTEEEAKRAAANCPGQVTVEILSVQSPIGVRFGFVMTPAVVVNGRVIAQGRVPQQAELERAFGTELDRRPAVT